MRVYTSCFSSFCAVAFLFTAPLKGFAATDGVLGATSTGSDNISLSINPLIKISHVSDINLGTFNGIGDAVDNRDVCIWTNQAGGNYKIRATGNGASLAYTVTNGAQTMDYSVKWNHTTGTSGNTTLTTNLDSSTMSGASTTSSDCGGGDNANFEIKISHSALLAVHPGTYSGVITFVVSPAT